MDALISFFATLGSFFVQFIVLAINFFIWLLSSALHLIQSLFGA